MTPQAARHRRQPMPRTVQSTRGRRPTAICCGPTVRLACACGNAHECRRCGAEVHASHPDEDVFSRT